MPSIPEIVAVLAYGNEDLIKKATEREGTCYCPVHEAGGKGAGHKTPSLGLWKGDNVPVLWKCRSRECDPLRIREAMVQQGIVFEQTGKKKKLLKSDECDVWLHPITTEMIDHRPMTGYINQETRPITYLYQYTDDSAKIVFFRARFEYTKDGVFQKQLRPLSYFATKDGEKDGWAWKEPPVTPFYYQHLIKAKPKSRILIVEGEKTADSANEIYKDFITLSICNQRKTDFKQLKDRHVIIFPDNDKPGKDKATKLAHSLTSICKTVSIVPIWDYGVPKKWDLADPLPPGIEYASFFERLLFPEQLKLSNVMGKCALIRMGQYRDSKHMDEDLRTLCSTHMGSQEGQHRWPSWKNHCEYCKVRGAVERPLDLLDTPEILTDWVYVAGENRFHNVYSNSTIGIEAFNVSHAITYSSNNNLPQAKVYFSEHPQGRQVDRKGYMPGKGIIYEEEGQTILNTWTVPTSQPVRCNEETIKPFFDLLNMLFNNGKEREAILDWMSYIIQNPGKTVNWAPILSGPPGCGKDSFFKVMRRLLGESNCTEVSETELESNFWDFGAKQFAIFEETSKHGRWNLYNKLKPFITNDKILVHQKGVQAYYVNRVTNYAMVTNSDNPIPLDEGDRRWFFVMCGMTTRSVAVLNEKDPEFWNRFHKMCDTPAALNGLLSIFMFKDISKFNPKGHSPDTPAKQRLIKESRTLNQKIIDDLLETRSWPFYTGIFSLTQITACIKEHDFNMTENKVSSLLRRDPRFMHLGRARRIRTENGKRISHFQSIYRLTHAALSELELEEDRRELGFLLDRIDAEIEPHLSQDKNDSKAQRFLYDQCFDKGWLNYEQTFDGHFTKEIHPPDYNVVTDKKSIPM